MRISMILPFLLIAAVPVRSQQASHKAQSPAEQQTAAAAQDFSAQNGEGSTPQQFRLPSLPKECPVEFRVDRRSSVIMREVDGKPIPTGQGLTVHFTSTLEHRVIAADITVHGYSGRVIAQPLTAKSSGELAESFHLSGSSLRPLFEKTLWTAKIAGVTWVELTRVVFSDGTTWTGTANQCRTEPSLFVLVNAGN